MKQQAQRSIFALAAAGALALPAALAAPQEGAPPKPAETPVPQAAEEKAAQKEAAKDQEPEKAPPAPAPQEQEKPEDETDLRDLNPFQPPAAAGGQQEIRELFVTVEKRLNRVTSLLYEASSGNTRAADDVGSAGIDELIREAESGASGAQSGIERMLQASRGQGEATLEEIGRILKLAEEQQSSQSGGGQQGEQSSPNGQAPQQGQTPSGSRKEEKGEGPPQGEQSGEQPGGQQPQPGGNEPSPQGDEPRGNQEQDGGPDGPAPAPADGATGAASNAQGVEDWGDLPIHLRKVFQNGVGDDVPPRYRDWVDSYYKRLNRD